MKKKLIITLSVILVTVISITVAQTMINKKHPRLSAEKRAEEQTKKMTNIYNLTEDQQKQIYLVNLEYQTKTFALTEDKSGDGTKKPGEQYLRDEHEKSVLPIFDANQKIKWDQNKEYRKKHPKNEKVK